MQVVHCHSFKVPLVYVTLCNCLIGVLVSYVQLRLIDLLPHGPRNNHIAQLPEPVNDPTIMDEASLEKNTPSYSQSAWEKAENTLMVKDYLALFAFIDR
jgi:hypothetical protein